VSKALGAGLAAAAMARGVGCDIPVIEARCAP
jgi:hypothetical protein